MSTANALPEPSAISQAADLEVLDSTGAKVRFGSIFEKEKVIIVFIQLSSKQSSEFYDIRGERRLLALPQKAYAEHLSAVRKEALEEAGTKIVLIGCGEWNPIKMYAETTGFRGPIYAEPSRKLYHALGMDIENLDLTPAEEQKRSYLTIGRFSNVVQSIWKGPLKNPSLIGKQGNISQLGGDFIFGPGNECSLASRMQHTEDHIEVADLMKSAGVSFP